MQNYVYEKLFCYILFESTTRVGRNSLCRAKTPLSRISVFNSKKLGSKNPSEGLIYELWL